MVTSVGTDFPNDTGDFEIDGGINLRLEIPELSMFALSSLGAAALMLIRRRK